MVSTRMVKRRGVIDLGSNSVLLTVTEGSRVIHDEARVVGLGKGLGDGGEFAPDRMQATLSALKDYATIARMHELNPTSIRAIATSASRRARNADAFYRDVREQTGLEFQIIDGEEEATKSFEGAQSGLSLGQSTIATIDLGGGSTEVVIGEKENIAWWESLEIGSARLTEQFLGKDFITAPSHDNYQALCSHIRQHVTKIPLHQGVDTVIAMAGTATTLGAIDAGLGVWNPDPIHGRKMTRQALQNCIEKFWNTTPESRQSIAAISPKRAEFLLAGALVIDGILDRLGQQHCLLSVRGLRFGYLS